MAKQKRERQRQPKARGLCHCFVGELAGCSRGGMEAVEAIHRDLVVNQNVVACSVHADNCRKEKEPSSPRWDYILALRDGEIGVGLEVHPANANEVQPLVRKKEWAERLVTRECPTLKIDGWHWIVPPGDEVYLLQNDSQAKVLAEAGIEFPTKRLLLSPAPALPKT